LNSQKQNASADARLLSLQIIWAAMLGSVFLYAVLGFVLSPPAFSVRALGFTGEEPSVLPTTLAILLYMAGLLALVLVAPRVLRSFLRRAESEQNPALVQTGFILAFAACEAGALVGLVILFMVRSWVAFMLMAGGALMIALMRPKREHVEAASYKIGPPSGGEA
jgi:hypothetical protein